jgi:hypothetical protein
MDKRTIVGEAVNVGEEVGYRVWRQVRPQFHIDVARNWIPVAVDDAKADVNGIDGKRTERGEK